MRGVTPESRATDGRDRTTDQYSPQYNCDASVRELPLARSRSIQFSARSWSALSRMSRSRKRASGSRVFRLVHVTTIFKALSILEFDSSYLKNKIQRNNSQCETFTHKFLPQQARFLKS